MMVLSGVLVGSLDAGPQNTLTGEVTNIDHLATMQYYCGPNLALACRDM